MGNIRGSALNKGNTTITTSTSLTHNTNLTNRSVLDLDSHTLPLQVPLDQAGAAGEARPRAVSTDLLWLPYMILTLALTSLLIASFLHFHCKNGHKYQRRRTVSTTSGSAVPTSEHDWRQRIVENALESNQVGFETDSCRQIQKPPGDDNPGSGSIKSPPVVQSVYQCGNSTREQTFREVSDSDEVRLRPQQVANKIPNHSVANLNYHPPGLCSSRTQRGPVAMINHRLARPSDIVYPLQPLGTLSSGEDATGSRQKKKPAGGKSDPPPRGGGVRTVYEYVTNCNGSMINMKCSPEQNSQRANNVNRVKNKDERRVDKSNHSRLVNSKQVGAVPPKGVVVGWSDEPSVNCLGRPNSNLLYRASKICRMDETDEDWEVLLSQSTI